MFHSAESCSLQNVMWVAQYFLKQFFINAVDYYSWAGLLQKLSTDFTETWRYDWALATNRKNWLTFDDGQVPNTPDYFSTPST